MLLVSVALCGFEVAHTDQDAGDRNTAENDDHEHIGAERDDEEDDEEHGPAHIKDAEGVSNLGRRRRVELRHSKGRGHESAERHEVPSEGAEDDIGEGIPNKEFNKCHEKIRHASGEPATMSVSSNCDRGETQEQPYNMPER